VTARLIALPYSPWSEKARWALDHHRVPYKEEGYLPIFGAPLLRLRRRRWSGPVTVPVLLRDGPALLDSWDIARHAEAVGSGAALFPAAQLDEITAWNKRSEALMAAARMRTTRAVGSDPQALVESLPPVIRKTPAVVQRAVGRVGVRYLLGKYGHLTGGDGAAQMRPVLETARRALAEREHLLDGFTYADITFALALQFIDPVADRYITLSPASRPHWRFPELAEEFSDLIAWRDGLYDRHRV